MDNSRTLNLYNYLGELTECTIEKFDNVFLVLLTVNAGDDEIHIFRENGDIDYISADGPARYCDSIDADYVVVYSKPAGVDNVDSFNQYSDHFHWSMTIGGC